MGTFYVGCVGRRIPHCAVLQFFFGEVLFNEVGNEHGFKAHLSFGNNCKFFHHPKAKPEVGGVLGFYYSSWFFKKKLALNFA